MNLWGQNTPTKPDSRQWILGLPFNECCVNAWRYHAFIYHRPSHDCEKRPLYTTLHIEKLFGELVSHLNPANKEDRKLAHSLGLATQEMLGSIARWADDGLTSVHGKSEAIARTLVTGYSSFTCFRLKCLTAASKVGFTKILMDKYGTLTRTKRLE